jgi:hypothetical protein
MSDLLQDSAGPTEFVSDMVAVGTVEETAIYPQCTKVIVTLFHEIHIESHQSRPQAPTHATS